MGKTGWSDVIGHDNAALDELFIWLPYSESEYTNIVACSVMAVRRECMTVNRKYILL